jgi:hypothetical protein
MQIKYQSEWMSPTIEIMKCIGTINKPIKNKKMGAVDYIIANESGKRLVRVMVNENYYSAPIYIDAIRSTIKELEEEKIDEITIVSNRITNTAHELIAKTKKINVITPDTKNNFSLSEILSAIQKKTRDICKIECGKAPETKEDCKGKVGRNYHCDILRISDDATFHATMKWKTVLLQDFSNLFIKEQEMKTLSEVN